MMKTVSAIRSARKTARYWCAEREKVFLGSVAGGAQAVGTQPDPGEESHQREILKDVRIADVARRADDDVRERTLVFDGVGL
jgi:hypothetical protein